ncbi:hypothetical protein, partial [Sphingopyxis sp. P1IMeth2]|uniref:hypothetical protein n=1 Tax=Sphingopyxis sp. P1IMeth2 TaxID=1892848 RepID=UPI001C91E116
NSHTGPQPPMLHCKAGQMAASDYVHYLQKSLASFGASTDGKRSPAIFVIPAQAGISPVRYFVR